MQAMLSSLFELRKFVVPEFIFGLGARNLVGRYAVNYGTRRALLVTDKHLRMSTPWVEQVGKSLENASVSYVVMDQVSPNPRSGEIMAGAALFSQERCNAIIAVGGGSVMDCAKGIGIVCSNGGHILDFEGVDRISCAMPPLICVPTTSGTGSEVSQFTIVLDEGRKVKVAIVSKAVVPDVGLIDPEVTTTMEPFLTACTGLDALTHAIEAFVSNASSPVTDLHALEAVRVIWEALPKAVSDPTDVSWRARMLLGSLHAGIAFSNAILGVVHALAHSLGGHLNLPHGECNAILLGPVVKYNYSACPEKYKTIGKILGCSQDGLSEESAANELCLAIEQFRRDLGVSRTLGDFGVRRASIPILAELALRDACLATNPRTLSKEDLRKLYEQAL